MQAPQAKALGLKMDLNQHAKEMHEGRDQGGGQDRGQRHAQIFDHQKGDGAHDRRRDLAPGG